MIGELDDNTIRWLEDFELWLEECAGTRSRFSALLYLRPKVEALKCEELRTYLRKIVSLMNTGYILQRRYNDLSTAPHRRSILIPFAEQLENQRRDLQFVMGQMVEMANAQYP